VIGHLRILDLAAEDGLPVATADEGEEDAPVVVALRCESDEVSCGRESDAGLVGIDPPLVSDPFRLQIPAVQPMREQHVDLAPVGRKRRDGIGRIGQLPDRRPAPARERSQTDCKEDRSQAHPHLAQPPYTSTIFARVAGPSVPASAGSTP
jgi:hypothetical protein